jgi:hypothetical protein
MSTCGPTTRSAGPRRPWSGPVSTDGWERPPAICFVDLTGYTRFTEEQGDEAAARLAADLAILVEEISLRRDGRAVRWLGDGGMFYFADPGAAVLAGLDMAEGAAGAGLPPTHIGIQAGPVIFQDGDVYGRTVNIAARIAARAGAGDVLTSEGTVAQARTRAVRSGRPSPLEGDCRAGDAVPSSACAVKAERGSRGLFPGPSASAWSLIRGTVEEARWRAGHDEDRKPHSPKRGRPSSWRNSLRRGSDRSLRAAGWRRPIAPPPR